MPSSHPNPVDVHVGTCIRARRLMLGLSQSDLAEELGITFQQVQKYERGTNRVSASMLYGIKETLKVPISYFFRGYDQGVPHVLPDAPSSKATDGQSRPNLAYALLNSDQGMEIAMATASIKKPEKRRVIIDMIKGLASD